MVDIDMSHLVSARDLCADYRDVRALDRITCDFHKDSLTAIVGPNGGGKSTFLKVLAGFQTFTSGQLRISQDKTLAYLPQITDIDRTFPISVGDVVGMGLCPQVGFFRAMSKQNLELIEQALESVGLQGFMDRPIYCLSGGQFQRVLFARIALQDASIILLDEPFAAVDEATIDVLTGLLLKWRDQGKTIITVLHDMEIVRNNFPETLILARTVIAHGQTADVLNRENLAQAKAYCGAWERSMPENIMQRGA